MQCESNWDQLLQLLQTQSTIRCKNDLIFLMNVWFSVGLAHNDVDKDSVVGSPFFSHTALSSMKNKHKTELLNWIPHPFELLMEAPCDFMSLMKYSNSGWQLCRCHWLETWSLERNHLPKEAWRTQVTPIQGISTFKQLRRSRTTSYFPPVFVLVVFLQL